MQNFMPRQTKRRAGPKKPARRCFYAVSGTVFLVGGQAERCTAAQGQRKQQRDVHAVAGLGDGHGRLRRRHHQGRRVVLAAARSHDDLLQFWRTRWIWFPCADIGRYPFCIFENMTVQAERHGAGDELKW